MSSKLTSGFDDLLAKSAGQMDDLMGRRSSSAASVLPPRAAPVVKTRAQGTNEAPTTPAVIGGTAGGVPFTLTTK
jgi:hypothetical protein